MRRALRLAGARRRRGLPTGISGSADSATRRTSASRRFGLVAVAREMGGPPQAPRSSRFHHAPFSAVLHCQDDG